MERDMQCLQFQALKTSGILGTAPVPWFWGLGIWGLGDWGQGLSICQSLLPLPFMVESSYVQGVPKKTGISV